MEKRYAGMTVNERLYVSGLMDEFDKAVGERDIARIRSILTEVELPEESIQPILEQLKL
ncbi:MAG TPA: hypothetical protein VIO81_04435 [Methyloversatilis sp.]